MSELSYNGEVTLCDPISEQANELFSLIENNRDFLRPWMAWAPYVASAQDSLRFLEEAISKNTSKDSITKVIMADDRIVGTVSLDEIKRNNGSASLGYWIDQRLQGRGVAYRSASHIIKLGFAELSLNKVVARCAVHNERSERLIVRLGFKEEGILRQNERVGDALYDQKIFSLLKSEWEVLAKK